MDLCYRGGCLPDRAGGDQGAGEGMSQTHKDLGPVRSREEGDGMPQEVSPRGRDVGTQQRV